VGDGGGRAETAWGSMTNHRSPITNDRRTRVQYSVFECELEPARLAELQARLAKVIQPHEDNVRYYRLCKDCLAQTLTQGDRPLTSVPDYWIV
jgi:CRISPR-associated protein Cas2